YKLLEDGGYLCIADLITEDGSFHHKYPNFTGHNGFGINELIKLLSVAGFKNFKHKVFYSIEKTINDKIKNYPLFILTAQKK
ncbi:class I SAM-dependent methyltransferase, partial [Patescibacteria group bacterium]|nr:class I SAM-dependent methyltransferase [Patescibacteria group bacterium]